MDKYIIKSVQDFIEYVEPYKGNYYFRGQANSNWDVKPKLFRDMNFLKNEYNEFKEVISKDNYLEFLKRIFYLQHNGSPTRLCDLTTSPLNALYFCIEDYTQFDEDGSVYIIDINNCVDINDDIVKLFTLLSAENISDIELLRDRFFEVFKISMNEDEIIKSITSNIVIKYNIELAFSNVRGLLQGGTGLFFGFSVGKDCTIDRIGHSEDNLIISEIIIPSFIKRDITKYLDNNGIRGDILYDNVNDVSGDKSDYELIIKKVTNKFTFNKVLVDIKVANIVITQKRIDEIVHIVNNKLKILYGVNARIWMYIYYNDLDLQAYSRIAYVSPNHDFTDYEIKHEKDYYKKRMVYLNEEISGYDIIRISEPVIRKIEKQFQIITTYFNDYIKRKIDLDEYSKLLNNVRSEWAKTTGVRKLKELSHGRYDFHEYYQSSNEFCTCVFFLIDEQLIAINRNDNDYLLEMFFKMNYKYCENWHEKYVEAYKSIDPKYKDGIY